MLSRFICRIRSFPGINNKYPAGEMRQFIPKPGIRFQQDPLKPDKKNGNYPVRLKVSSRD
jgi:hypothetical protein